MYGFVVIIKNVCYAICFTWTEIALHFVNNLFMTTVEYAYKRGAKFLSNTLCNICYRPTGRRQITYLNKHLLLYNYRTCVCGILCSLVEQYSRMYRYHILSSWKKLELYL